MRLDEWQRYIDSEFVEPTASGIQIKSGAGTANGPSHEAGGIGDGAEIEMSDPSLGASESSVESEPQADITTSASGPSQEAIAEIPYMVASPELMDDSRDPERTPTDTDRWSNPSSTGVNTISTIEAEIPPFADYISKRRTTGDSPVPRDPISAPALSQEETHSLGNERAIDLTVHAETGPATAPGAPHILTAPAIILEQLRTGSTTSSSSTNAELARRREGLLQRLLDPVLSDDDTALLLGVSVLAVREYVESGVLRVCEAPRDSAQNSRANQETRPRYFRLSDITRFAASRERAGESESLFTQPGGPDQAS